MDQKFLLEQLLIHSEPVIIQNYTVMGVAASCRDPFFSAFFLQRLLIDGILDM